jgi:hypothetical protein
MFSKKLNRFGGNDQNYKREHALRNHRFINQLGGVCGHQQAKGLFDSLGVGERDCLFVVESARREL